MNMLCKYAVIVLILLQAGAVVAADGPRRPTPARRPVKIGQPEMLESNISTNKLPFRISAMTKTGDKVYLGLIDEGTGRTLFLKRGELTWSGYKFLDVDYEKGRALFKKGGKVYAGSIAGSDLPDEPLEVISGKPVGEGPPELPEGIEPLPMAEKMPDETFVLMIDSNKNESMTVYAGEKYKDGLRIEFGEKNYAIPRNVASGLLRSEFMSDEMKARALKSFPGLVELEEGENVDQALEARGKMAFPDIPPPPVDIPERPPMMLPPSR